MKRRGGEKLDFNLKFLANSMGIQKVEIPTIPQTSSFWFLDSPPPPFYPRKYPENIGYSHIQ